MSANNTELPLSPKQLSVKITIEIYFMAQLMIVRLAEISTLLLWPLSFLLFNSPGQVVLMFTCSAFVIISYVLSFGNRRWQNLPLLAVGIINPALSLFPIIVTGCTLSRKNIYSWLILIGALLIFLMQIRTFMASSVFAFLPGDIQMISERSNAYPSLWTARIFQNKLTYLSEKFQNNFFAIVDLNNYFFNFHPREITVINQNLDKFPFLAILFLLIGIYKNVSSEKYRYNFLILGSLIINLSLLSNFDRLDFILFIPLAIVVVSGIKHLKSYPLLLIYLFFTSIQYLRLLLKYD